MELEKARKIADKLVELLEPHCERISIAGSIRREKPEVKDIEIVCIPKPYETGIFESGIATVVNKWPKVKGELPCKYTQRIIHVHEILGSWSGKINLDLFFAVPGNWGLILAIRTGSAKFSHEALAKRWVAKGYNSIDGWLHKNGKPIAVPEEEDLFRIINLDVIDPIYRNINGE